VNTPLNAGDVVDLLVYRNADAAQDSIGLNATFATPEPSTYVLTAGGLSGLIFLRRRAAKRTGE
jgi:hypothetical protein